MISNVYQGNHFLGVHPPFLFISVSADDESGSLRLENICRIMEIAGMGPVESPGQQKWERHGCVTSTVQYMKCICKVLLWL